MPLLLQGPWGGGYWVVIGVNFVFFNILTATFSASFSKCTLWGLAIRVLRPHEGVQRCVGRSSPEVHRKIISIWNFLAMHFTARMLYF